METLEVDRFIWFPKFFTLGKKQPTTAENDGKQLCDLYWGKRKEPESSTERMIELGPNDQHLKTFITQI